MSLIEIAIRRPVAVLAVVFMVLLMGWVALQTIPIQLTPDLRKPFVQIMTIWPGASPTDMEREITNRQEEALKALDGLDKMESTSRDGICFVNLEFQPDVNMDRALLLIGNALNNIAGLPADAREPQIRTRDSEDNPIAWFTVNTVPGNNRDIYSYGQFIENVIQDRLERLTGVAVTTVFGGNLPELHVIVDPNRMARYGLAVPDVVAAMRGNNASMSAGVVEEGKRRYLVRTDNELTDVDRINNLVLRTEVDRVTGRIARVRVSDVAKVKFDFSRTDTQILTGKEKSIIVGVIRDTGVNIIEIMKEVKKVVAELNAGPLPEAGLVMTQVHDDTIYINSAIGLVQQNIIAGGLLAALVLLIFLRSWRATLVVSMAIPVSVIGSFVAMAALGRSINVISLAGIAFAVGMVVDAAIVVLENIYRHRQMGESSFEAALNGAKQVWGAILVSAMTTVMVFAPILVMKLEAGQLFRDIAVALSVSVLLSLLVSVTVIPALANRLLTGEIKTSANWFRLPLIDTFGAWFVRAVNGYTRRIIHSKVLSVLSVAIICGVAGLATWQFLPKLEYLPEGSRNLVLARILTPPGYNLDSILKIADETRARLKPLFATDEEIAAASGETTNGIAQIWDQFIDAVTPTTPEKEAAKNAPPKIARFWFIIRRGFTLAAAAALDPTRVTDLMPIIQQATNQVPGSRGFVFQASIFGRGFGGGRDIELNISGPDLDEILNVAGHANQLAFQIFPRGPTGAQIRPNPGLQNSNPEVRLIPDPQRLSDNGLTARDLGETIDAFNDGIRVAQVTVAGKRIDLMLMGPENIVSRTQGIDALPVVTRTGNILPASSLAKIEITSSPETIRHLERERTVSLNITPPIDIALETAMEMVRNQVIAPLQQEGLPSGIRLTLGGTADALTQTFDSMVWNLALALVIVYLVMAILFESFIYPFIIMFSVPLATAGGVGGLYVLHIFTGQALDMLTLLGFVILIGVVVNNAILIVHQTIVHVREDGMAVMAAIMEATNNRIRPIFMSTLTSVFGMLPLALFPGAGSELYRGLGSVVIGGLSLSAILTLLIIPPLLGLVATRVEAYRARRTAARAKIHAVAADDAARSAAE